MTEEMKDADFRKKLAWVAEHCADRREWEGVRIGNLSREDAVFLFGESVIAGLDKMPFSVNCPLSSNESYTDPDARHEKNPDLEFHESIVCRDKRGRRLGNLIHVDGGSRPHYLFDRVETLTRDQKISRTLQRIGTNNSFILRATRQNEKLAAKLKLLLKKQNAAAKGGRSG